MRRGDDRPELSRREISAFAGVLSIGHVGNKKAGGCCAPLPV